MYIGPSLYEQIYIYIYVYIYIERERDRNLSLYINIYIYIYTSLLAIRRDARFATWSGRPLASFSMRLLMSYGKFLEFQNCFCGLDPGNLKFETVRTNKQHICF